MPCRHFAVDRDGERVGTVSVCCIGRKRDVAAYRRGVDEGPGIVFGFVRQRGIQIERDALRAFGQGHWGRRIGSVERNGSDDFCREIDDQTCDRFAPDVAACGDFDSQCVAFVTEAQRVRRRSFEHLVGLFEQGKRVGGQRIGGQNIPFSLVTARLFCRNLVRYLRAADAFGHRADGRVGIGSCRHIGDRRIENGGRIAGGEVGQREILGVERIVAAVGGRPKGDLVIFVPAGRSPVVVVDPGSGTVGQTVNLRFFRVVAQNGDFDSAGRRSRLLDFLVAGAGADQKQRQYREKDPMFFRHKTVSE